MSSAPCTAWLAWKLWQICGIIKAPSLQPAFAYFFVSAQPYSINFAVGQLTFGQMTWTHKKTAERYFALPSPSNSCNINI